MTESATRYLDRDEILEKFDEIIDKDAEGSLQRRLMLEVLIDIRDILETLSDDQERSVRALSEKVGNLTFTTRSSGGRW